MSLRGKTHPSGKKIVFPTYEGKTPEEIEEKVICARCKNAFEPSRTVEEGGFILCLLCAGEFNNREVQDSKPQVDESESTRPTHKGVCSNCGKSVYIDKNSLCYKCRGGTAE